MGPRGIVGPKKVNARAPHLVLRRMGAPIKESKAGKFKNIRLNDENLQKASVLKK